MATSVAWRDLTLGAATGHKIVSVEGWESLPAPRYDKQSRSRAHGSHSSPVWSDERLVTVTAEAHSASDRDRLLLELRRRFTFDGDEEPLAITMAGRTLTAQAQLLRCDPVIAAGSWNVGQVKWVAQWRCPDPLRYGPVKTASTALPTAGGGLTYPSVYPSTYGAPGNSGQLTLDNSGTADAAIVFDVVGGSTDGLQQGFEVSAGGRRITYPTAVPAGQTITVDTATGSVVAEGTADRRGELTFADWLLVPRAAEDGTPGKLTVQFTSLGGAHDPTSLLTARWQEANW